MSRLTCELLDDPELLRIADEAREEVTAEEVARVEAERSRLLARRSRFDHARARALRPEITLEMVADRIHELTNVRKRLRRAETELRKLRSSVSGER